jgi:hypothetical protein
MRDTLERRFMHGIEDADDKKMLAAFKDYRERIRLMKKSAIVSEMKKLGIEKLKKDPKSNWYGFVFGDYNLRGIRMMLVKLRHGEIAYETIIRYGDDDIRK